MNLDEIIAAADALPENEREILKDHLTKKTTKADRPQSLEEWKAKFRAIAEAFRGDSTDEEMKAVFEAMNAKSIPTDKGL